MAKGPKLADRLTPLSMALAAAAVLVLETAFGLFWTSLNEFRAGTGFRRVLAAYGSGLGELAAQELPGVIEAKPARYPHPRMFSALLKIRSGSPAEAAQLYEGVLAEKEGILAPRERAICMNGLGVARVLGARSAGDAERAKAFAEARGLFQQGAEAWPELPESDFNQAVLDLAGGRFDEAGRILPRLSGPDRLPPGPDMARNLALLRMLLAEQRGDWDAAVAQARSLRGYHPAGLPERAVLARALGRQLRAPPLAGRFSTDETECEALLSRMYEPVCGRERAEAFACAAAWRMEGYWSALQRKAEVKDEAWNRARFLIEERLCSAQALDPGNLRDALLYSVQRSRDLVWRNPGMPAEQPARSASGALQGLLAMKGLADRQRAVAENNLAFALAALSKLEEALPHAERATALAPGDPVLARNRAVLLDLSGKPSEAAAWYEAALKLQPGQADVEARLASLRRAPPPAGGSP